MSNNQKLREALMDVAELIQDEAKWADEMSYQQAIALGIIQSALAESPRNCERFNNADELVAYYGDEGMKEAWRELREKIKNGKYEFAIDLVFMIDWLFAEAEGEAK